MEMIEMILTVDESEPITFQEFYKINTAEDVEPLSEEEFEDVKNLEIGKSIFLGMGVEIKRIG